MNNPRTSLFRKGFFNEKPSFGKSKVIVDVYELDNILDKEFIPVLDSLRNVLRDANGLRLVIKLEGETLAFASEDKCANKHSIARKEGK